MSKTSSLDHEGSEEVRNLVMAAHRLFAELQKIESLDDNIILEYSIEFRSQLKVCLKSLDNINHIACETIDRIEKLWYLCEVFQLTSSSHISIDMCLWFKEYVGLESEQVQQWCNDCEDESPSQFWDFVYQLAMEGELEAVEQSLRARYAVILQDKNSNHCDQLEFFLDTLKSHPFAAVVVERDINSVISSDFNDSTFSSQISAEFVGWQHGLYQFEQTASSLLRKIPQFFVLIRILTGDLTELSAQSQRSGGGGWATLSLAALLYKYPPPLTRSNLAGIVSDFMAGADHDHASHTGAGRPRDDGDDYVHKELSIIREIMKGNVTPALIQLYETSLVVSTTATSSCEGGGGDGDQAADKINNNNISDLKAVRLLAVLSMTHFTYLLAQRRFPVLGGQVEQQAAAVPVFPNEGSFLQELLLECGELLADSTMLLPAQVLLCYLGPCGLIGRQFAASLLCHRPVVTDAEALQLAALLRSCELEQEAQQVLRVRATWWMKRAALVTASIWFCGCAERGSVVVEGGANNDDDNDVPVVRPAWRYGLCIYDNGCGRQSRERGEEQEEEQRTRMAQAVPLVCKAMTFCVQAGDGVRCSVLLQMVLWRCAMAAFHCHTCFPQLCMPPWGMRPVPTAHVNSRNHHVLHMFTGTFQVPQAGSSPYMDGGFSDEEMESGSDDHAAAGCHAEDVACLRGAVRECRDLLCCMSVRDAVELQCSAEHGRLAAYISVLECRLQLLGASPAWACDDDCTISNASGPSGDNIANSSTNNSKTAPQQLAAAGATLAQLILDSSTPYKYLPHFLDLACCFDSCKNKWTDGPQRCSLFDKNDANSMLLAMENTLQSFFCLDLLEGCTKSDIANLRSRVLDLVASSIIQENATHGVKSIRQREVHLMKSKLDIIQQQVKEEPILNILTAEYSYCCF